MNDAASSAVVLLLEVGLLCAGVLIGPVLALRRPPPTRGRRLPALALHRAQRDSLDRDRAAGLLGQAEHRDGGLEIDRRLLAEAEAAPDATSRPALPKAPMRAWVSAMLLLPVLAAAVALYWIGGHPLLPAEPLGNRIAAGQDRAREDAQLVTTLRSTLSQQDPSSPETRQGYLLLAQAEAARGDWAQAAAAWRTVLQQGFDPVIAVQAAEAQSRADDGVSAASAALFRRALREGSKDAPWRSLAEGRIAAFEHQADPH